MASTLFAIGTAEVALRAFDLLGPRGPVFLGDHEPAVNDNVDLRLGWRMPPHIETHPTQADFAVTYQSNGRGFRDDREFEPLHPGPRIVFLGDSFTFGNGVELEETFVRRVEAAWPAVRTYNLGISGYGVDQMWMALRHEGRPLRPDLVVLSFVNDDLRRSLSGMRWQGAWMAKPAFRRGPEGLVRLTPEDRPALPRRWVQQRSRLFEAVRRLQELVSLHYPVGCRWALNRDILRAVDAETQQLDARLVVMRIPERGEGPAPMFGREFEKLGIPFLDLVDSLPAERSSLYFRSDPHTNPEGHRLIAAALIDFLEKQGLRPH